MEASDGAGKTSQESPSAKDSLPAACGGSHLSGRKTGGCRDRNPPGIHRRPCIASRWHNTSTTTNFDPFRRFAPSSRFCDFG